MQETIQSASKTAISRMRQSVVALIGAGRFEDAEAACDTLQDADATAPDAWVYRARIAQKRNDFITAAAHSAEAVKTAPDRLDVRLVDAECLMYAGDVAGVLRHLDFVGANQRAGEDDFKRLSALYTQLGRHERAYQCAQKTMSLAKGSLNYRYLIASAAIAVGKMDEAETLLDEIIAAAPGEGDIYYNRATLRKQTKDNNHIDQIRQRLAVLAEDDPRMAPLSYSLGKELEDIGEHDAAFAAYSRGAKARRNQLSYDVAIDERTTNEIISCFDARWRDRTKDGALIQGPIFILGLPRSGTTLVDRIVSAHSAVTSLEEVNDFAYGVIRAGHPAKSKKELIERSSASNMATLGKGYWRALSGYGEPGPYFIDKTPANYLYLGLIAKALPNAAIVHVRRHPLASVYAMFKTLFRMGYPFSYDLQDLARYYLSYHRLMEHWRALFPGRILDVQYEDLVDRQEAMSRAVIGHCGLEWESACLDFHKNEAPTATASAAQVRQPIYRTARDLWRVHENALQPAVQILKEGGVSCA
ncbi:MAG: sulfotransferase [Pseudomonadota bacterium]